MIVGILGGIGSGKSTVTRMFVELGAEALDADEMAHEALETPAVRREVIDWLGTGILGTNGSVDRRAVARRVFKNPGDVRRLQSLVHPEVLRRIDARIHAHRENERQEHLLILDVPLLLETPLRDACQVLIYVDAPLEARRLRAVERHWDPEEVEIREKFQTSNEEKKRLSDFVIDNGGKLDETRRQVESCHARLKELAVKGRAGHEGPVRPPEVP